MGALKTIGKATKSKQSDLLLKKGFGIIVSSSNSKEKLTEALNKIATVKDSKTVPIPTSNTTSSSSTTSIPSSPTSPPETSTSSSTSSLRQQTIHYPCYLVNIIIVVKMIVIHENFIFIFML